MNKFGYQMWETNQVVVVDCFAKGVDSWRKEALVEELDCVANGCALIHAVGCV